MTTQRQDPEEQLLHSVALKNARSILLARQRAEHDLVTAKEELETRTDQLARSLSLVRATLESTADGILATGLTGDVTEVNRRFVEIWGVPPEVLSKGQHRPLFDYLVTRVGDTEGFRGLVEGILATAPPETLDVVELADGRVLEQFTRAQELGGEAVGRVWSYRDITERAQVEAALREAKESAEASNRAKSEFLAVMSHELRTPLNAIGGYVELLELGIRGSVNEEQLEDLQRIRRNQRHLLGLINEVLNYARIEAGSVQYDVEDVNVLEAFTGAAALIEPQVREKGLKLSVVDCSPEVVVRADLEKLRQILLNLLSNAVKFTPEGGTIELLCDVEGEVARIMVRDTGIGIPEDKLLAIFDPFVQVRSDLARTSEGAGLGLAISRDLARGMGGDLIVESTEGGGSRFIVIAPVSGGQGESV